MKEYNIEKILEILEKLNLENNISLQEIPTIPLYMDQVITLFEMGYQCSKREKDEKILTKTMINNYSKAKLFPPVINKKYTKEHIICMILIYKLKQGLSISDIKIVLQNLIKDMQTEEYIDVERIYKNYLNINLQQVDHARSSTESLLKEIDELLKEDETLDHHSGDYEKKLLATLSMINLSNIYRKKAEAMIDSFIRDVEDL